MINLLNNETQRQYRAARLNLKLRSYFAVLVGTLIGVLLIFGGGFYLTLNERAVAQAQVAENNKVVAQYAPIKTQADEFTANLKIAKSILSQEVLYSDMITRIASTLPQNAVLSSLMLDQQTLSKPVMLTARVKTKSDAITLKTTLENSPIFENVNINSINEETIAPEEKNPTRIAFPVIITISMTITKGTPESLLP